MTLIRQYFHSILFTGLSCLLSVSFSVRSQANTIQVVVNPSVESKDFSVEQIQKIFSMRQTIWSNGQAITVYVLPYRH